MKPADLTNSLNQGLRSFGVQFGRLVRFQRGVEGWTQEELAIQAFGDPSRKSMISSLENGRIPNPQQKTVDALCVALRIEAGELSEMSSKWLDGHTPPEQRLPIQALGNTPQIRKITSTINLADAMSLLAAQQAEDDHLQKAIELYEAALLETKSTGEQVLEAEIWTRMGQALKSYSEKTDSVEHSKKAVLAFENALRIIAEEEREK
jgi:transcriptional regulator with XRE-family HTH domain